MHKNSILQLFAKSNRVTGLSAKQRVQRVPDSSNSGSDLFKNNGFVYKWKLLTAFPLHGDCLSICLGFIITSPLENYNTEHILLEVCGWAEYSGPRNSDNSWRVSLQKRYNSCMPTSGPDAARLWQEGSIEPCRVEHNLKNVHVCSHSHNLTLAAPWNNGCFLCPSLLHLSFLLFFPFP